MDVEDRVTRRKTNDLVYDAANAKLNLKRAGRPFLLVGASTTTTTTTHRSRIAPFIDLSQVRLIYSSPTETAADEPFSLMTSTTKSACLGRYDILTDFGAAYQQMIHETSAAYRLTVSSPCRSNSPASESSATSSNTSSDTSSSSLSDTESDDSCREGGQRGGGSVATILVTTARLDDNPKIGSDFSKFHRENPRTHCISCPTTASISMEEAIGVCESPRLVTLSSPPYTVVFCNAAFAASTGFSSDETLGKSLHDLVAPFLQNDDHHNHHAHDDDDKEEREPICLESCAASSSAGIDTSVCLHHTREFDELRNNNNNNNNKCGMKVLPIISRRMVPSKKGSHAIGDARELNNITHFSLELFVSERRNLPNTMVTRAVEGPMYVTAMG